MSGHAIIRYRFDQVEGIPASLETSLSIYDVRGRLVRRMSIVLPASHSVPGADRGGWYTVIWDGLSEGHNLVSPGIYWAEILAGDRRARTSFVKVR